MGDGLSVLLPPYLSPPYFSALWSHSVPSPWPLLTRACGEAGLLGPSLFRLGRKVQRESRKLRDREFKEEEEKREKNQPLLH